jgi:hypothetical protein
MGLIYSVIIQTLADYEYPIVETDVDFIERINSNPDLLNYSITKNNYTDLDKLD